MLGKVASTSLQNGNAQQRKGGRGSLGLLIVPEGRDPTEGVAIDRNPAN